MNTVDYSPYDIPNPDPAKTYAVKYPGLVQATQDTDNALIAVINTAQGASASLAIRLDEMTADISAHDDEISNARAGEVDLNTRLNHLIDIDSGLTGDLAANNHKISGVADAVNGQDVTTLSQVNALLSGGGNPADINLFTLDSSSMNNGEWISKSADQLVAIDSSTARTQMDVPSNTDLNNAIAVINAAVEAAKPTIALTLLYS